MASIIQEPNGRKTIQFTDPENRQRRPKIRLGKVTLRDAQFFKHKIERLLAARVTGDALDADTAQWIANLTDEVARKLAAVGLIEPRAPQPAEAIGPFLDSYIAGRAKLKPNTRRNYLITRRHLVNFFGSERGIADIAPGDADDWREKLLKDGLSEATISREVKRARQFFRAAVRRNLIAENPFADLPAPQQVNKSREFFVSRDVTQRVLDACPDAEWRLLVALSRYGGLRCPSEHLALKWIDVNWEQERITIRSPKTEHHRDGASRTIPIFPELRPYLEECREQVEPGEEYVITRYRDKNVNLRTQLLRILERVGVQPWPKLFQNLRSSRETELTEEYPIHVVCAWIGNSERIAAKHYLQVTDDHFEQASRCGAKSGASDAPTERNPVKQRAAEKGDDGQEMQKTPANAGVSPQYALACDTVQEYTVPPRGVEPLFSD